MARLNKVILIGRLTRAPIKRTTSTGMSVGVFTLAVDRPTSQGSQRKTDFINIACFGKLADNVCSTLTQGRLVAVDGSLRMRDYVRADGTRVRLAEVFADNVQFLDYPRKDAVSIPIPDTDDAEVPDLEELQIEDLDAEVCEEDTSVNVIEDTKVATDAETVQAESEPADKKTRKAVEQELF